MLNLLIAFIWKSYEKVITQDRYNFNYERANILLDMEIEMGQEEVTE